MWLIFSFSLLNYLKGDDQYDSQCCYGCCEKKTVANKGAHGGSLVMSSEISLEQSWRISAAVFFTMLETNTWEDLPCPARPPIFTAWEHVMSFFMSWTTVISCFCHSKIWTRKQVQLLLTECPAGRDWNNWGVELILLPFSPLETKEPQKWCSIFVV